MENKKGIVHRFGTEPEREVAVCIAVQKIGMASVEEIMDKVEKWGGKLTEKQVIKVAENLRKRQLFSIDLSNKKNGISVKRYLMKTIKLALPEIAQIKDVMDDPSVNPLKEELDRSKKTRKKGLKTFDYYNVEVLFDTKGDVQGFLPDSKGVIKHYRKGNDIVLHQYHFKNWFRANLPLINRTPNSINDIYFNPGTVKLNGTKECHIIEKWVTNVESGFDSSRGTGGRGSRLIECLPNGSQVITTFKIPRDFIPPERIKEALTIMCQGKAFGGGHKLSTGRLEINQVQIVEDMVWKD